MNVWQQILAFLQKYPACEYGPAHVVLSDGNLDDDFLDSAIVEVEALLEFLQHLKDIPEDDRIID